MNQDETREVHGTSRQAEEAFLEQTLSVIHSNLESYGEQVGVMREEIDVMLDHFHDDNPELINLLENTTTLYEQMKMALERNEKAKDKPYFGRIDFYDESLEKDESIYIGKCGISRDATHQAIVDWRAPVSNAYYENGLGKCSYTAPGDRQIPIDLKLKRTYEIEKGKLLDYFDSEVVANDDLLTKYLSKNKQAVLGEIVATIQKEQNDIIRKSPYHNIIVQGVAGSGKTTVAMHRISFILYNYQDRFKPDDFYIVGSNRILLNYITGVLPDLDVYGIRQMTMEQLFVRLLYEDWDEKKYSIKPSSSNGSQGSVKGTLSWFEDLKAYCDDLEWSSILRESIYLNPKQFVEGLRDGKNGVYDTTVGKKINPYDLVRLVDGEAVERYILQNPKVSMQSKINMLNDRLIIKIKEEFTGKGVKYTESERKAILKAYRGRYGAKVWKGSIYETYRDFLRKQAEKGIIAEEFLLEPEFSPPKARKQKPQATALPTQEFDVYDLAALAYIYKRLKETEVISEAHHIVIDEAQDYGMMAYSVLNFCIEACTYTIMGDVSQNIHFGFGLNDWEELRTLLLTDKMDSFGILKKSYRNTVEISDFATAILHHGRFSSYPVEPIIRHGDPVRVEQCTEKDILKKAAETCRKWQERGFGTIAVVCRNQRSANLTAEKLGEYIQIMESDLETAEFGNGIMVLPVEYTKGLEFDTVLILDPTREEYPVDDGHAKLLYVAATRALHELCILHTGELTGLIADPVPETHTLFTETETPTRNQQEIPQATPVGVSDDRKRRNGLPENQLYDRMIDRPSQSTKNEGYKIDYQSQKAHIPEQKNDYIGQIANTASQTKGQSVEKNAVRHTNQQSDVKSTGRTNQQSDAKSARQTTQQHAAKSIRQTEQQSDAKSTRQTAQQPAAKSATAPSSQPPVTRPTPPQKAQYPEKAGLLNKSIPNSGYPGAARPRAALPADTQKQQKVSPLTNLYSAKPAPAAPSAPAAPKPAKPKSAFPAFGDIPPTEKLRPMGHSKIDLSIRWVTKQSDGLYLQSRYGTLRLSPIGSAIIRVSFARNGQPDKTTHPGIAVNRTEKFWMYKDLGGMVELTTDELALQVDKATGGIRFLYLDEDFRNKKLLLTERKRECRQLEAVSGGRYQTWLFLDFAKEEHLYAFAPNEKAGIPLKGTARYLTGGNADSLALLLSDKGYGILTAADSPVFCCDIPAYGSYLHADSEKQLDYYFIAGKRKETIINAYAYLCGDR